MITSLSSDATLWHLSEFSNMKTFFLSFAMDYFITIVQNFTPFDILKYTLIYRLYIWYNVTD